MKIQMSTRIKIHPKILRFGRQIVAIKTDPLWDTHKNADTTPRYGTGPIVEAWPVGPDSGYPFTTLPEDPKRVGGLFQPRNTEKRSRKLFKK